MMRALLVAALLAALPTPLAAATPAQLVTVKVNGLVCDFCARSIEAVMKRRKDVERVHVDLDKGEVHVALRADATLSDPELAKLILDSGYAVSAITREPRP
ncbi:heavy-metal-associated domain-containing protein [Thermaurantiacus sp.]